MCMHLLFSLNCTSAHKVTICAFKQVHFHLNHRKHICYVLYINYTYFSITSVLTPLGIHPFIKAAENLHHYQLPNICFGPVGTRPAYGKQIKIVCLLWILQSVSRIEAQLTSTAGQLLSSYWAHLNTKLMFMKL